jgi:transcriptional regulator with XRE-family HTH domain
VAKLTPQQAFGVVLRELRTQRGFTQESFALECDVDRTFVGLMERGERQPTLTTLYRLAGPLGVRPSALLRRVETLVFD